METTEKIVETTEIIDNENVADVAETLEASGNGKYIAGAAVGIALLIGVGIACKKLIDNFQENAASKKEKREAKKEQKRSEEYVKVEVIEPEE